MEPDSDSDVCDSDSDSVYDTHFPAVSQQPPICSPPDDPRESEDEQLTRHLLTVHRIFGHPSNKLLQQILRGAHAPHHVFRWQVR